MQIFYVSRFDDIDQHLLEYTWMHCIVTGKKLNSAVAFPHTFLSFTLFLIAAQLALDHLLFAPRVSRQTDHSRLRFLLGS